MNSGVIERLAQDCTPGKWTVGDRVMALLPGGGNAEIVSVHEDHLMPLPKTMTFREAAAIPEVIAFRGGEKERKCRKKPFLAYPAAVTTWSYYHDTTYLFVLHVCDCCWCCSFVVVVSVNVIQSVHSLFDLIRRG